MNHKLIVVKQMKDEADKLRSRLAELEAGIRVLGGSPGAATRKPVARRSRPTRAKGAAGVSTSRTTASAAPVGPALQAELDRIKADTKLSPIQKAQASRKARLAAAKGASARPEGAVLSEAAAAS